VTVWFATGTGSFAHIMYPGGGIIVNLFSKHDAGGVNVDVSGTTDVGWMYVVVLFRFAIVVCRASKGSAVMRPLLPFRYSIFPAVIGNYTFPAFLF
jgi:hypothetical protein